MHSNILLALAFLTVSLAGCLGGTGPDDAGPEPTPTYEPGAPPAEATGLEHVARLLVPGEAEEPFPSGSGIWVHEGIVYGSALGNGFFIADVRDPERPELLHRSPEDSTTGFSRDADLVLHPDGAKTLVLATQSDGMHLYDVTDPTTPEFLARLLGDVANHNVAVVPGTQFVFNSRSGGEGDTNDLVDVRDPRAPEVVGTYGTHGCHDISFHGVSGEAGFRAYCAGIDRTEIWDLEGLDPSAGDLGVGLVSVIEAEDSPVVGNPLLGAHPVRTLHHLAIVNEDASVLIVGDEHNGGGSPGACALHDETLGLSTPLGALWFYDISDETAPELLGWFSPPAVEPRQPGDPTNPFGAVPNCTAHFGTVVPGQEVLVMAWYTAGVVLVDFSDPAAPTMLDQFQPEGVNTWDARIHGGHVFTGDMNRGMDVLKLV